jgi:hypothetical protein
MLKLKNIIKKQYFLTTIFILLVGCVSYAKNLNFYGFNINLNLTVSSNLQGTTDKEESSSDEDYEFSSNVIKNSESNVTDRFVDVKLTLNNLNPYEAANIKISEIIPPGFRQIDKEFDSHNIQSRVDSKGEIEYSFRYIFDKTYIRDKDEGIIFDENGNVIGNASSDRSSIFNINNLFNTKNKNNIIENKDRQNINDDAKDLRYGVGPGILILLIFLGCIILFIVLLMLYRSIKGNFNSFHRDDYFKSLIIFFILGVIAGNKISYASNLYVHQLYEYGKTYEKVIFDNISFNDSLYRFAYAVTIIYENKYEITEDDYNTDTDGDGLYDALEYQYMTDKNNVDSDGDMLSDYLEVMSLDYNPLSKDTFGDGVNDSDRDFDNDKLSNIEEIGYGTELYNSDTDYDTLSDFDEVKKYLTNPLSIDSDDDLLNDADELKLGLDPNNPKSDGITLDSERKIHQRLNLSHIPEELKSGEIFICDIYGEISGNIDNEIKVANKNEELFNVSKAFVHKGFRLELKENETVNIELDVSKVSDRKLVLTVVKYKNGEIYVVDTNCSGDVITATVDAGVYSVVDSEILLESLNIMINDYIY